MTVAHPIRLALLGAGLFTRVAHIPALLKLEDTFRIAALYSRSPESAQQAAALVPYPVDITHDLNTIWERTDIDAVAVILPILAMPEVIQAALKAGKHVLSEKPLSPTLAEGQALVDHYQNHTAQVWLVAENWRYAPGVARAQAIIQSGTLGALRLFSWTVCAGMTPDKIYYHTPWRRDGSLQGGFLLDGGIHFMAGLRAILGEVASVSAMSTLIRPDLPPVDTLTATLQMESGLLGTLAMTYSVELPWSTSLTIVGENGVLEAQRDTFKLTLGGEVVETVAGQSNGVHEEWVAFAHAIQRGTDSRPALQDCLGDVRLLEALLTAAQRGVNVKI